MSSGPYIATNYSLRGGLASAEFDPADGPLVKINGEAYTLQEVAEFAVGLADLIRRAQQVKIDVPDISDILGGDES